MKPQVLRILGRDARVSPETIGDADGTRLVVQDWLVARTLTANGRRCEVWDDHFPRQRHEELAASLRQLRSGWHRVMTPSILSDAMIFDGIDIAELMDYGLNYILVDVIRSVEIVRELLDGDPPDRVVAHGLRTAAALVLVHQCQLRGIPCTSPGTSPGKAPETINSRGNSAGRPARHSTNPLQVLSRWGRVRRRMRALRRSRKPLRILYREGDYSQAVLKTNHRRLAAMPYRRGGRQLPGFLLVASLLSPDLRRRRRAARTWSEKTQSLYREHIHEATESPILMHDDINIWPYVKPHLDALFLGTDEDWRFDSDFAQGRTRTLQHLLNEILLANFHLEGARPDVVLVTQDSWDLDKVMVSCARARGIPSANLQHGIPAVYYPLHADRFLVWGDFCVDYYCHRHGEPRDRIVVTGRPRRDYLAHERAEKRPVFRTALGVPEHAQVVLFIGQPSTGLTIGDTPIHWQKQLSVLLDGTRDRSDLWVVIRPHPAEDRTAYEKAIAHFGHDHCKLAPDGDLLAILDAADVIVLRDSTVSLDALHLEKPMVILDVYSYGIDLPFAELDGISVAQDIAGMAPAIDRALAGPPPDPNRSRFLAGQVRQDGARACHAVYDALMELHEAGKSSSTATT